MRLAVFGDTHAHLPAVEAVLADVQSQGIDHLVCLGDVVTLGLFPAEVLDLLADSHCRFVQGNHDQAVLDSRTATSLHIPEFLVPAIEWARSKLSARQLDLIATFEPVVRIETEERLAAFIHASPRSNCTGIPPTASEAIVAAVLDEMNADVVAVGHTHCQMSRAIGDRLLLNPGSVGSVFKVFPGGPKEASLQPWAEYAVLDLRPTSSAVEFRKIPFSAETVRRAAIATRSPERQWWLRQYT
jgi:predicted phosphodiesterase